MSTGFITGMSGVCVDVQWGATTDGTPVWIWDCNDGDAQGWQLTPQGTIQGLDGKCLTAAGGSTADHTPIVLTDCTSGLGQQWDWALDGTLRSGGKCLDIPYADPTPGNPLQIYDCVPGAPNQQWVVHGATQLRNEVGGCLDLAGGVPYDGAPLDYYDCVGVPWQNWVQTPQGFLRALDGECVQAGGTTAGSPITIGPCTGAFNQIWIESSSMWLPASAPGLCMQPSAYQDGASIELGSCSVPKGQHWDGDALLTVSLIPQQQSNWCWAASSEMVMAYMGDDVAQCEQANQELGRSDCCSNPGPCNVTGTPTLNFNGFTWANNAVGIWLGTEGPLSFDTLVSEIQNARPVIFAWNWAGGGGHVMVVIGATVREGVQWVTINDPWSPNQGDQTDITYATWVAVPGNHTHQQDYWNIKRSQ